MIGNIYVTTKEARPPKCYIMIIKERNLSGFYDVAWWGVTGKNGTMGGYTKSEINEYLKQGTWEEVVVDTTSHPCYPLTLEDDDG